MLTSAEMVDMTYELESTCLCWIHAFRDLTILDTSSRYASHEPLPCHVRTTCLIAAVLKGKISTSAALETTLATISWNILTVSS